MTQCWAVLRAEDVYTGLLRDDPAKAKPGARGSLELRLPGRSGSLSAAWELRANAARRFGRVFFRCPKCARLATRLYVPLPDAYLACRRCWGLTYESRQERNYKDGGAIGRALTSRVLARSLTYWARQARADAAAERYAERRAILERAAPGSQA